MNDKSTGITIAVAIIAAVLLWATTDGFQGPVLDVFEGGVINVSNADGLDFDDSDFNVTESPSGIAQITVAGSLTGAPANLEYLVLTLDPTLTAERRLVGTAGQIILTDAGANADATLSLDSVVSLLAQTIETGEITDDTILEADLDAVDTPIDEECLTFESGAGGDFEWDTCGAGGGAPTNAQYVVMALDATLSDERVLTGTTNQITVTDGGAGGNATLSTPQDINATANVTFAILTINDLRIDDDGSAFDLILDEADTLTADRTLTFNVADGNQSLTIEAASLINQDLTTDASPTFDQLTLDAAASSLIKGWWCWRERYPFHATGH